MPQYAYLCEPCGAQREELHPIGEAPRTSHCHVCGFDTRLVIGAGVQIAPSALEGKGQEVRNSNATEARWNKDMPAYYRMRKKGMQPASIDGAAALEDKCHDQVDVEYGRLYAEGVTRERVLASKEEAADLMATGIPL